ncbi:MAG: ABC transporter ATP-binding protein [Rhodobacteraceae bacterium]|nr:MAG: ABC transporter ATP-binding protein [Paracoccaceae bacterium]
MLLEVSGLRAGYGNVPVLRGIDFAVKEREFVGILGHNGMGKSTLLNTLMGRIRATDGVVRFKGADVTRIGAHRRSTLGMGLVPQGREIFPNLSVMENLLIARATRRGDPNGVIEEALEDFPRLKRLLDRRGGALSGGEQQLLALARCLCADPKLILLDEPTEGIQPSIIEEIVDTLHAVKKRRELAIVLVEQNLDFIAALAERVLIIQRGVLTREIPPSALADADTVSEFVGFAH